MSEPIFSPPAGGKTKPGVVSGLTAAGIAAVALCLLVMAMSGFGTRLGLWPFRTGFAILKWGAYAVLAASAVSLIGLAVSLVRKRSRDSLVGIAGVVIGLYAAWVPWSWLQAARTVPPIHDISTNTVNPPRFVAILPLRRDAPNPAEYGGPDVAAQQRSGYPDLGPALLPVGPEIAFKRALEAARKMGWEIVYEDAPERRIEATDTTFWFGFKDDIVIRVDPDGRGSRVDVRSVSRVGRSDVGTNARRIRRFFERLY
jgi:uncharacterized protein (DUF1499 family)